MQTISTTDLRTDLTGLLQNIDKPLAITKRGNIVAYLVGPSHNPLEASNEASPSAGTSGASKSVNGRLKPSIDNLEEDDDDLEDWDMSMNSDFERYLSGIKPENRPSY